MTTGEGFCCRVCHGISARTVVTAIRDWEYLVPGEWDYHVCTSCGIAQLHPFPNMAELSAAYPEDYAAFAHSERKGRLFGLLSNVLERQELAVVRKLVPQGARVLDVGCGDGSFLSKLRAVGADAEGLDFSRHAVDACERKGFRIFHGTLDEFERSSPGGFDIIVMRDYLEHSVAPRDDLESARRLLARGGKILLSVPNFRAVDRLIFGRYWGGNHAPRHTFQYSDRTLPELLRSVGFGDVQVQSRPSPTCYALSAQNWIERWRIRGGPRIKGGRAWYYSALLLVFAPLHLVFMPSKRVGMIDVTATVA